MAFPDRLHKLCDGTTPAVSFAKLSWQRYLDILWYAVEIDLEHYGHAFYSTRKEYAVLRTGAKDGIVPQIVYSVGETVACKKCMKEFVESVEQWQARA